METRARGGDWDLEEGEEKRLMLQQVGEVRLIAVSMPPSVKEQFMLARRSKNAETTRNVVPNIANR